MPIATKWPRLLVFGDAVTQEQANEILIRTNNWYYIHTNDKFLEDEIITIAGLSKETVNPLKGKPYEVLDYKSVDRLVEDLHVLDLRYLSNERICSSWIGGAHGWCDWNGKIFCSNYNIGKWPTLEEVHSDWEKIAAAFPFLSLIAQTVEDEGEANSPCAHWEIGNGEVKLVSGIDKCITHPTKPSFNPILSRDRERGVNASRLKIAIDQVRNKFSTKEK